MERVAPAGLLFFMPSYSSLLIKVDKGTGYLSTFGERGPHLQSGCVAAGIDDKRFKFAANIAIISVDLD